MKRKILIIALVLLFTVIAFCAFACGPTIESGEREDYIEGNGWYGIISLEEGKTARLMGNRENCIVNGEAVIPTKINGYAISCIDGTYGIYGEATRFKHIPDKLFVPGVNYVFPYLPRAWFPKANKKIVFLSAKPRNYSRGFSSELLASNNRRAYTQFEATEVYIVPKESLDDYKTLYDYTLDVCGIDFKGANVSYYYNFDGAINEKYRELYKNNRASYDHLYKIDDCNNGYYWIDDLEVGDKIKTVPPDPIISGYEFCGWFYDADGTRPFDFDTFIMGENELEIYAQWKKN